MAQHYRYNGDGTFSDCPPLPTPEQSQAQAELEVLRGIRDALRQIASILNGERQVEEP